MRINYVAYLNPYAYSGGGEVVLRALLDHAVKRGHEVEITSVLPRPSFNTFDRYDIFFLADVFNCPWHWKRRFHRKLLSILPGSGLNKYFNLIDCVMANERYIHFDNAYVDVCDKGYLPCNGLVNGLCIFAENSRKQTICFAKKKTTKLYRNSELNVFVSPLHKSIIEKVITAESLGASYVCKPIIDTRLFYNRKMARDIENLYVGVICEAKGIDNLRKIYKDKDIYLIGQIHHDVNLDFGTYLGKVDYEQVAEYMSRAEKFVYLPRWPEPQGRVVVEAALCGCKLVTNDNVGATSFDFNIADPANLENPLDEFWNEVERKVI